MSIEAMKQALEALKFDGFMPEDLTHRSLHAKAITAIKQARSAPMQEPVAWATTLGSHAHVSWGKDRPDYPIRYEVPLYTTPQPQREWVGLTYEEHFALADNSGCLSADWVDYARSIEAKLKEKNT